MKQKPSETKSDELQSMHDQIKVAIDFLGTQLPPTVSRGLVDAITHSLQRKDKRGVRQIFRDTQELLRGITSQDRKNLGAILHSRSLALDTLHRESDQRLAERVLNRERVRNEEEFQVLEQFVENNHDNPTARGRIQLANRLLAEFVRDRRLY